jgi:hypothetical protein|tara:strand:+ start:819 stop:983 length:165 start_codon:yes stop_codon:yes gene_type:complete
MSKIIVRVPEPKEQYEITTQRQINRALTGIVDQLNSTFQQSLKEEQEQLTWFLS